MKTDNVVKALATLLMLSIAGIAWFVRELVVEVAGFRVAHVECIHVSETVDEIDGKVETLIRNDHRFAAALEVSLGGDPFGESP